MSRPYRFGDIVQHREHGPVVYLAQDVEGMASVGRPDGTALAVAESALGPPCGADSCLALLRGIADGQYPGSHHVGHELRADAQERLREYDEQNHLHEPA